MVDPNFVQQEFQRHLKEIHLRGMGLSVDVYSPDLLNEIGINHRSPLVLLSHLA